MPFDPNNYEGQDRLQHHEKYIGQHDAALATPYFNPLGVALGIQFEPYPPSCAVDFTTNPTSGRIVGVAVYATAGATIAGIKMRNATAAAGTLPTTVRFGLADNTGKILVLSSNLNALASWGTGALSMPFTAPFTLAYTGVYFPCYIVNGSWGTTQPAPIANDDNGSAWTADGTNPPVAFQVAGQTDLPAIGSSVALTTGSTRSTWMALY